MSDYWKIEMKKIVDELGIELSSSVMDCLTASVSLSATMQSEVCGNGIEKALRELLAEARKENKELKADWKKLYNESLTERYG